MAMTQLQKLELNKRVDKIFHAPSNVPAGNHQPEIAFVTPMSGNLELVQSSIKDAVASLKAHDKMFQNMRSNMVYWASQNKRMNRYSLIAIQLFGEFVNGI